MTIRAITAVLTIAGTTFLVGCTEEERRGGESILASFGVPPVSPAPAVAYVTEVVEPPKVAWEEVCWTELHRGGTMEVRVCENRQITP